MCCAITENDESQWDDITGVKYHFPKRYLKRIAVGMPFIYYKGRIQDRTFRSVRLSDEPHYFGAGRISKIYADKRSNSYYYAELPEYRPFDRPIHFKKNEEYLEDDQGRRGGYFRQNSVRTITAELFDRISHLAGISNQLLTDLDQGLEGSLESEVREEGKPVKRYSSAYERDPKLRADAVRIHGYTCQACGFNFNKTYGEWGKEYIHVHHLIPIAKGGVRRVNPQTDLVVLCANCHSMVHRRKSDMLGIEELKEMIRKNRSK